jgi:hypothetical protein
VDKAREFDKQFEEKNNWANRMEHAKQALAEIKEKELT